MAFIMRILMVTDKMGIGGAETHIATLVRSLIGEGHRVTVLSAGGVYADDLKKKGAEIISAPLDKRDILSMRKARAVLEELMKRADIVHAHTRFSAFLASDIRGASRYPALVTTVHLNFPLFPFGPLARFGDRAIAVSEDIRDYLTKHYGIRKEDVYLTKNAIDTTAFGGERQEKKLIVHTSRIDTGRSKCAFALVDIAYKLLSRHKGYRILIIGDGNMFQRLSKRARRVNSALGYDGIILAGGRDDVAALLKYASVFVGVSRAALEAMAFGIPTIIAGDQGYGGIADQGSFDLMRDSNFCARGQGRIRAERLLSDLTLLMESSVQRRVAGEFCKSRIVNDFSPESMTRDALNCYHSVLRAPSLCLVGFFGYSNLGDEQTLVCAAGALKAKGIKSISVLCESSARDDILRHGITPYDRMDPYEVAEAVRRADILVLCGGNLLQNETSLRSLLYYEQIIMLAKRMQKSVYMLSSGIGDVKGLLGKRLLKRSLDACDYLGMRTGSDLSQARLFCGMKRSRIMPDLCFLMSEGKAGGGKRSFALIISANTKITPAEVIRIAGARGLFPKVISLFKNHDERRLADFSDKGIPTATPADAAEFRKLIAGCEFTVCDRLHGAIFSIISHTPAYITEDSGKHRALLAEMEKRRKKLGTPPLLLPYSLHDVAQKKEAGVKDSDFEMVISDLKNDIKASLEELFVQA